MTVVAMLNLAAALGTDPYLAAADRLHREFGHYGADSYLTAAQADRAVVMRSQEPAFRAAIDAALAVERTKTGADIRRLCHENGRLRGRIVGALAVIRNARNVGEPGHAAAALGNVALALGDSRDELAAAPALSDFA